MSIIISAAGESSTCCEPLVKSLHERRIGYVSHPAKVNSLASSLHTYRLLQVGMPVEHGRRRDAVLLHEQQNQQVQNQKKALFKQRPHRLDRIKRKLPLDLRGRGGDDQGDIGQPRDRRIAINCDQREAAVDLLLGLLRHDDQAFGGARSRCHQQQVALGKGGGHNFTSHVAFQAQMHQPHAEGPGHQAGSPCARDKDTLGLLNLLNQRNRAFPGNTGKRCLQLADRGHR